jgi:hypothetical protein
MKRDSEGKMVVLSVEVLVIVGWDATNWKLVASFLCISYLGCSHCFARNHDILTNCPASKRDGPTTLVQRLAVATKVL